MAGANTVCQLFNCGFWGFSSPSLLPKLSGGSTGLPTAFTSFILGAPEPGGAGNAETNGGTTGLATNSMGGAAKAVGALVTRSLDSGAGGGKSASTFGAGGIAMAGLVAAAPLSARVGISTVGNAASFGCVGLVAAGALGVVVDGAAGAFTDGTPGSGGNEGGEKEGVCA